MNKLIETVKGYIQREQLIPQGCMVVAGVSGGADSVCLLRVLCHLAHELDFAVSVVHVEHGLRGQSSQEDAAFTAALCHDLGVFCQIVHVDAAKEARRRRIGTEEAARLLRGEAFDRAKAVWQGKGIQTVRIATAHHADDQAETVLLNLTRGTGMKGMGGIQPIRGDRIHPLLLLHRHQIERALLSIGQSWQTDETNLRDDYSRNVIRHRILPVMEEQLNTQSVRHICEAADEARRVQAYLEKQTLQAMEGRVHRSDRGYPVMAVPISLIQESECVIRDNIWRLCIAQLRRGLALKDIGRGHIQELNRLSTLGCGRAIDLPGGLHAVRVQETVELRLPGDTFSEAAKDASQRPFYRLTGEVDGKEHRIELQEGVVTWRYMSAVNLPEPIPELSYTKWLSCAIIASDVCLRTRQTGDYLLLDAHGLRKKLQDFLIDKKIPRDQRDEILLVAQGHHILWVIGQRISAGAKVNRRTTDRILKITYQPYVVNDDEIKSIFPQQ